jgi:hypothetical protein
MDRMHWRWLGWSVFLLYVFLLLRAYAYLRDRHGSNDASWLEGLGALYVAPVVAPFMPFIWLNQWVERRREAAQIRSGRGPLTGEQRLNQRNVALGAVLAAGVLALILFLLLGAHQG